MFDVISIKCIEQNCNTQPTYNVSTQTKALYCLKHKKNNMVDVKHIRCIEPNCLKQPLFNISTQTKALYCLKHKKDNMIDVKHIRCVETNCTARAIYNVTTETKALYCKIHKKDNMTIKGTTCIEVDCNTRPTYNILTETKPIYCLRHKKDNMINVINSRCIEADCTKLPTYNDLKESKPLYCKTHKKDNMINVTGTRCKTHMCEILVSNKKYKGYCLRCFIHLFPDQPVSRNYKTKEHAVVEYILEYFKYCKYTWVADKTINNGCSMRRPDLLLDLGYQVIIIEIDENQHDDYDCSCQNKRTMELSQDVGHCPIIFIRFNPDGYLNNKTKITSCWSLDGRGICVINKFKTEEWSFRLKTLSDQVKYWTDIKNKTDKTVEIVQLFYDTV
jgi:hypothetical protein